jgi:hypothetical protein
LAITSKLNAPRTIAPALLFTNTTATSAVSVPLARLQSWSIKTVAGLQSRNNSASVCGTAPFAPRARNALGNATASASSTPALSAPIQIFCFFTVTSNPSPAPSSLSPLRTSVCRSCSYRSFAAVPPFVRYGCAIGSPSRW